MSTIHFIGGEKGAVGKSVVARVLAQQFIDRDEPHLALDTDQSHATLSRYYEDFTQPMNLDSLESTDAIMEKAAERDAQMIIDLPAQSQRFLDRWMAESGVLELCEDIGMPLLYWYTVDDGPDSMQLLEQHCKALAGSDTLGKLTSVPAKVIEKGTGLLQDNEPFHPKTVKIISKGNVVRDEEF